MSLVFKLSVKVEVKKTEVLILVLDGECVVSTTPSVTHCRITSIRSITGSLQPRKLEVSNINIGIET